jgi:gas vesicle protein
MSFDPQNLVSNLQHQIKKFIGGLLLLTLVWQGVIFGVDNAIAAPLVATSADSISQQATGKAEQIKGSARESMGKAQSAVEDKQGEIETKIKSDLNDKKIAIDANSSRVDNAAEQVVEKVKNFFVK